MVTKKYIGTARAVSPAGSKKATYELIVTRIVDGVVVATQQVVLTNNESTVDLAVAQARLIAAEFSE